MKRHVAMEATAVITLLAGMGLLAGEHRGELHTAGADIPIAQVKRGELDLKVYTTGELRAIHSTMLTAPPIGGGALQITRLMHTGTRVKKGDVVLEFDPSEQRYKLEQSHSELLEAEQDIIKAKADAAVQGSEDQVALLKARFDVRKAQLDVQKNELVSAIDAKKNLLALDQALRALAELQQDIKSHAVTGKAGMDLAREKWNKAKLAEDQARQNIKKMRVVSPIDGLVAIQKNLGSSGGIFFEGESIPDYHEGDQVQPGSPVAQVIDLDQLELTAKVSELERANIHVGEPAEIELDALPQQILHGRLTSAAGMVQRQFWETGAAGRYDITVQLTDPDTRLRPGLTAQIVLLGEKKDNSLYIPRQALFQKDGKQVVYLRKGGSFAQLAVKVDLENESRAAVEGLREGEEVALIDPTAPQKPVAAETPAGSRGKP